MLNIQLFYHNNTRKADVLRHHRPYGSIPSAARLHTVPRLSVERNKNRVAKSEHSNNSEYPDKSLYNNTIHSTAWFLTRAVEKCVFFFTNKVLICPGQTHENFQNYYGINKFVGVINRWFRAVMKNTTM